MVDPVFAMVRECAAAYRALTGAYDQMLLSAHNAGLGTQPGREYLRRANDLAPEVMLALSDYQAAVVELACLLGARSGARQAAERGSVQRGV